MANTLEIPGYKIFELIGEGGFSKVYRARKLSSNQIVAIKLLKLSQDQRQRTQRSIERFNREAQLCSQLYHPHIVRLGDTGKTPSGQYFAEFEFVPGETLDNHLQQNGPMQASEAGDLMGQVLDALCCAHARGIIHRDLKPQNIVITKTGSRTHAKILDFGIGAYAPEARLNNYKSLTLTHETLGTPSYCAPEQLRGETPTVKSDLYSWGLIFMECLSGEAVMQAATLAEIYHRQLNQIDVPIPPAIAIHPLGSLLRRVLQKRVDERAPRADIIYSDFRTINLANIVGNLGKKVQTPELIKKKPLPPHPKDDNNEQTIEENLDAFFLSGERIQVTSLCCRIKLSAKDDGSSHLDFEVLDAFSKDLKNQCLETGLMFGGYHGGSLGDTILIVFGYPYANDDDCQRAARSALEIVKRLNMSAGNLRKQQQFYLDFGIGIHTGMVMAKQDTTPSGMTIDTAIRLALSAARNTIVASEDTLKILKSQVCYTKGAICHAGSINNGKINTYHIKSTILNSSPSVFSGVQCSAREMIGRREQIHNLLEHFDTSTEKSGQLTLILGDAGVGKSRLIHEFKDKIKNTKSAIFESFCLPEYKNTSLHPILMILKTIFQLEGDTENQCAVKKIDNALKTYNIDRTTTLPILCSWLSIPNDLPPLSHSPQKQKEILFLAIESLFSKPTQHQVFIIEDAHWMDPTTTELLNKLIHENTVKNTLIILTGRRSFKTHWDRSQYHLLDIPHLSENHTIQLIQSILGNKAIADTVIQKLCERIDGIPLFAEELISTLQEKNLLVEIDGNLQFSPRYLSEDIPMSLRDSLNQRLQNTGETRETAQIAAVLGRQFQLKTLAQVSLRDENQIEEDMKVLMNHNLLVSASHEHGDTYIFRHALIRDAAYDSIRLFDRKNIHKRAALTMEHQLNELGLNPLGIQSQISMHYAGAEEFNNAVKYGTEASIFSLERFQIDETITEGNKVKEWITKQSINNNVTAELEINRVLMQALMAKYGWADNSVEELALRTKELSAKLKENEFEKSAVWAIATSYTYYFVKGYRQQYQEVYCRMSNIAETLDDKGMWAAVFVMEGFDAYTQANYPDAINQFKKAIATYTPSEHKNYVFLFGFDILAWSKATCAIALWQAGDHDSAMAMGDEAISWSRQIKHMPSICISLLYRAIVYNYAGDKLAAKRVTEEILDLSSRYGLPAYAAYASLIYYWASDNPLIKLSDEVIKTLCDMGCNVAMSYYASLSADIAADAGEFDNAVERIDACLKKCKEYDEYMYEAELYRRRANYRLMMDSPNHQQIVSDLNQAIFLSKKNGMASSTQLSMQLLKNIQSHVDNQIAPIC